MNPKIERYLNGLFAGVPKTREARDLREELLGNMQARYRDYLAEGKGESEAYGLTVASMGDLDAMLAQVMPDETFRREAQAYRRRKARNTCIAIALYFVGVCVLLASAMSEDEAIQIKSLIGLLAFAAAGTILLVYTHMSTPEEFKAQWEDEDDRWDREIQRSPGGERFKMWMSIYWSVVTAGYLLVSFLTMAWQITWIVWPLAAILSSILRVIFLLRHEK